MNKKIYFNDKYLEFYTEKIQPLNNNGFKFYKEITDNNLKEIESAFLNEKNTGSIFIKELQFEAVFNHFKKKLSYIEAAGGLIKKEDSYLFIFRLGRWDLPKGKLDKGETIEKAAIRECEEECGVKNLTIINQLPSTYHIYPYKNNFAIKQTFWFAMQTDYNKPLKPQLEENITDVKWFTKHEIENTVLKNTYYTIEDVVLNGIGN